MASRDEGIGSAVLLTRVAPSVVAAAANEELMTELSSLRERVRQAAATLQRASATRAALRQVQQPLAMVSNTALDALAIGTATLHGRMASLGSFDRSISSPARDDDDETVSERSDVETETISQVGPVEDDESNVRVKPEKEELVVDCCVVHVDDDPTPKKEPSRSQPEGDVHPVDELRVPPTDDTASTPTRVSTAARHRDGAPRDPERVSFAPSRPESEAVTSGGTVSRTVRPPARSPLYIGSGSSTPYPTRRPIPQREQATHDPALPWAPSRSYAPRTLVREAVVRETRVSVRAPARVLDDVLDSLDSEAKALDQLIQDVVAIVQAESRRPSSSPSPPYRLVVDESARMYRAVDVVHVAINRLHHFEPTSLHLVRQIGLLRWRLREATACPELKAMADGRALDYDIPESVVRGLLPDSFIQEVKTREHYNWMWAALRLLAFGHRPHQYDAMFPRAVAMLQQLLCAQSDVVVKSSATSPLSLPAMFLVLKIAVYVTMRFAPEARVIELKCLILEIRSRYRQKDRLLTRAISELCDWRPRAFAPRPLETYDFDGVTKRIQTELTWFYAARRRMHQATKKRARSG